MDEGKIFILWLVGMVTLGFIFAFVDDYTTKERMDKSGFVYLKGWYPKEFKQNIKDK